MIRSELIDKIAAENPHLTHEQVRSIVATFFETLIDGLSRGQRVEIRGFGAFTAKLREPRRGRNPRTGEPVAVERKQVIAFKASRNLLKRMNDAG